MKPLTPASFRTRYGPWAVVAGAGVGLGAAWATALARLGLDLVLIDRESEPLTSLCAQLGAQHGIVAQPHVLDLGVTDCLDHALQACEEREIGLLVYNAAASAVGEFLELEVAIHERMLAVNCAGPMRFSHHFGRLMRQRGRGGIILMSSLSGFQGSPMLAQYAATKAYNLVLAEGLWDECRDHGVDVLACCPGATLTPGYIATQLNGPRLTFPPEMKPEDVVDETLAALGRQPHIIPGWANRISAFALQRLASRRRAISILGRVGRKLAR